MDQSRPSRTASARPTISLAGAGDWNEILAGASRTALQTALAQRIAMQRWFGSKARTIRAARILDTLPLTAEVRLMLVEIQFTEGPSEVYQLPLALATGSKAARLLADEAAAVWARVEVAGGGEPAALFDELLDDAFCGNLLGMFDAESHFKGERGEWVAWRSDTFAAVRGDTTDTLVARLSQAEQSNSSVIFGDRLILKLFRRLETGPNPEVELTAHLTRQGFAHVPPLAGAIEYRQVGQEPCVLGVLQQHVPNQGDAWQYFLGRLETLLRETAASTPLLDATLGDAGLLAAADEPIPPAVVKVVGPFLADAKRLGQRTAEMHLALAAGANEPDFAPHPLSLDDQRAFSQRTGALVEDAFELLRRHVPGMSAEVGRRAEEVLACRPLALDRVAKSAELPIDVHQIRCHGDYHLGQVLVTDGDFAIIDFEGEPARPLSERRKKQLALRDVAGMIRSFHYASRAAAEHVKQSLAAADAERIDHWAAAWYFWTGVSFLAAYRQTAGNGLFVPASDEAFGRLLDACLLEKAVYELRYELNNRPDWVYLPLAALAELLR